MYHYWPLFAVKLHYLGYFAVIWIQMWIFYPDFLSRCRFWSGWTQIYLTYCNVALLDLICCKMALFGLFCCNLDPDPDFWSICRFWSGWAQIYLTYCNVPLLGLICPKMPLLGLFCCNRIQIQTFDPDADFDQDGPRYTALTVIYHY